MTFTSNYPLARSSGAYVLAGVLAYLLAARPGILPAFGLAWLLWETIQFLQNSREGVLQLLRPIALLTMWVAPAASYVLADTAWYSGYRLWVPAEAYFRLAGPGTAALLWGLQLSARPHPPTPSPAERGLSHSNNKLIFSGIGSPSPLEREGMPLFRTWPRCCGGSPSPLERGLGGEAFRSATQLHDHALFFWILLLSGLSMQILLPITTGYFRYPVYLGSLLVWPALLLGMQVWPARRNWLAAAGTAYALALAVMSTFFGMALLWVVVLWASPPNPLSSGEGETPKHRGHLRNKSISPLSSGEGEPDHNNSSDSDHNHPAKSGDGSPSPLERGLGGEASRWRKLATLAALAFFVLFLISFKYDYREQKTAQPGASGLFFRMAWDKLRHPAGIFHPQVLSRTLSRLNQGFHTAQAMAYVPAQTPFVYGETLVNDLWGALVPRFLDSGKPRAGGKENLRRFAGQAHYRISANIGVYGEAYVNFGTAGGWAVLLAYGGLLGVLWHFCTRWLGSYWGPYVFLPAVQLESDIGIVLNHISKSTVVAVAITLLWHGITHLRRRTHAK